MSLRILKDAQKRWAQQQGIDLIGSKGDRGEPAYTPILRENMFEPIRSVTRREFENGNGEELETNDGPAKMQAVHSSAALTVNVFDYWRGQENCDPLLQALSLPADSVTSIEFEAKRPIMDSPNRRIFKKDPNLDVILTLAGAREAREVAIECKFTEIYRSSESEKKALAPAYVREEHLWTELPYCLELARRLCPRDEHFVHLHAAQLLKHILGLKYRNDIAGIALLYLWYDVPRSSEAKLYREEIDEFCEVVQRDGISFLPATFQHVIAQLSKHREGHERYVDYLVGRYL